MIGRAWNHLRQRLSPVTIAKEVTDGAVRLGGQGAAEVAQAMFTGNGFVPYGPTERPLPVISREESLARAQAAAQHGQGRSR